MTPQQLLKVLDSLLKENLHGPIFPLERNSRASSTRNSVETPIHSDKDLDSQDPRWKALFISNFIETADANDDLLFFVVDSWNLAPNEQIIVKRRILGSGIPSLGSQEIDWKKTFFLNLISQCSCYLTVAICDKEKTDNTTNEQKMSSNLTLDQDKPTKPKMTAINRIVKKVFSAPYKSRMDVKDASMNECSYPLVYYTVNDFESSSLQLPISQNEYLCVELCILLPEKVDEDHSFTSMTKPSSAPHSSLLNITSDDLSPFPTPPETIKIILFQGAVPFLSLMDVYAQKGLAAQNSMKLSWSRLNSSSLQNSQSCTKLKERRTEYIMMRGPKGKGQCQVAITSLPIEEEDKKQPGLIKKLSGVATRLILGPDRSKSEDSMISGLIVSITYVNMAWQSIVHDLFEFAKETRTNRD